VRDAMQRTLDRATILGGSAKERREEGRIRLILCSNGENGFCSIDRKVQCTYI
jgi:hypothetical protein